MCSLQLDTLKQKPGKGYFLGLVRTEQRAVKEIPLTGNITLHRKQKRMDNKYSSKFDHELR